ASEGELSRGTVSRAVVERLARTMAAVPVRKRIMGDIDLSSGFGVRPDPFLGRPAMHSGLDFRSETGDPVRATANGTVESAGWSGGYRNMIQIEHRHRLATPHRPPSDIH